MSNNNLVLASSLAGAGAGVIEAIVMQPADTMKTRIQSSRAAREYIGKGAFGACRHLIQTEGFLAFYKGLTPILLLSAPRVTLQYTGLAFFLPKFEVLEQRGYIPPRSASAFAGICTGMSQAVLLITPLELIKVRQQTQISSKCSSESKYTSSQLQTIRTIIREEGISALWKGLTSTAARQAWGLVLKFTMYNEIKGMLAGGKERIHELEPAQHMLAGGLANVVVGVLNSPPDVVKTRMQDTSAAYTSTWDCVKQMWVKEGGPRTFFKGAMWRVIRIAPGGAIQFGTYEFLLKYIKTKKGMRDWLKY